VSGSGTTLTIGELAKAAGVPASTVRYYERAGLLRPVARSPSNYRLYSSAELERLRFIRAAQATGFSLGDVTELLRPAACAKVQTLIEDRLSLVAERMKELRHVRKVLRASLEECHSHEATGRCKVVDELTARARSRRAT
jgi:MerR family mercuric resistance operon transcriptional regulator